MSQATIKDVTTVPRIAHGEAMQIAAAENAKFATLLRSFEPGDWAKPTDFTLWDARVVSAHIVGSAAGQVDPEIRVGSEEPPEVARSPRPELPGPAGPNRTESRLPTVVLMAAPGRP